MITYKFYDETESLSIGDRRVVNNEVWEALTNITGRDPKDMEGFPPFSLNWIRPTGVHYLEVSSVLTASHLEFNLTVDDITFVLPDPVLFGKRDLEVTYKQGDQTLVIETHDAGTFINETKTQIQYNAVADNITFRSTGTGWQVKAEVIDMPPLCYSTNPSVTQTFVDTRINVGFDTLVKDDGGLAHLDANEIVMDKAGDFIFHITLTTKGNSGNNRSETKGYLQVDPGGGYTDSAYVELDIYNRQADKGSGNASQMLPLKVTAGTRLRLQCVRTSGSDTLETVPAGCNITIFSSKGLRGEAGAAGPQGPDGADGDMTWEGVWSAGTFNMNQAVEYQGSSFVCVSNGTTTSPGDPAAPNAGWDLLARKGADGAGATISISDQGSAIPNTPHGTLNFIGDVESTDAGGGVADIEILGGMVQPYLSGNDPIVLFDNVTDFITLLGDNFDNNLEVDLGPAVTVNSITAVSPNEVSIGYSTGAATQTATAITMTRKGYPSFGQALTCVVTDVVIGTGSAGTWVNDFTSGGTGQALLGSDWTLWIDSAVNSFDGLFHSSAAGTPSGNTGPSAAYDGNYLFTERSNPNNGASTDAYIETSNFRSLTQLSFYFHAWGNGSAGIQDLVVYSQNANGSWTEQWRHTGDEPAAQADPFVFQSFNTTTWDCKAIRIGFENCTAYQSDTALDDITFISV